MEGSEIFYTVLSADLERSVIVRIKRENTLARTEHFGSIVVRSLIRSVYGIVKRIRDTVPATFFFTIFFFSFSFL